MFSMKQSRFASDKKKHLKCARQFQLTLRSSQLTFTCSKSTTETLENGVKYVQR